MFQRAVISFQSTTIKDPNFKGKPIKITEDDVNNLIERGVKIGKRLPDIPKDFGSKPVLVPTIKPKNGMPSVTELKTLHVKVADIIHELKQLSSLPVRTLFDYQNIVSKMEAVRDKDYETLKQYMHSIDVPQGMAEILITTLAGNWSSSVAVVRAKKKAAKGIPQEESDDEDEVLPTKKPIVTDEEEEEEVTVAPSHLNQELLKKISAKGQEVSVVTTEDEAETLLEQLKEVYVGAQAQIKQSLPTKQKKMQLLKYLSALKGAYEKQKSIISDKLKHLSKPPISEEEWDDDAAETPTDEFTPVDDDEDLGDLLGGKKEEVDEKLENLMQVLKDVVSDVDDIDDVDGVNQLKREIELIRKKAENYVNANYLKAGKTVEGRKILKQISDAAEAAHAALEEREQELEKPKPQNVPITGPAGTTPKDVIKPQFQEEDDKESSEEQEKDLQDFLNEDEEEPSKHPEPYVDENEPEGDEDEPFPSGFDKDDYDDMGFPHDLGAHDLVDDED